MCHRISSDDYDDYDDYKKPIKSEEPFVCPVCFNEFSAEEHTSALNLKGKLIWITYCNHMLCLSCACKIYITIGNQCPMCRGKMASDIIKTSRDKLNESLDTPLNKAILHEIKNMSADKDIIIFCMDQIIVEIEKNIVSTENVKC
jgi:hypothetical protein